MAGGQQGVEVGSSTTAELREEKGWQDGPYCHTKQHGSSDDPPDFHIPIDSPAPAAKSRQYKKTK